MLTKPVKASTTEIVIFTSAEYNNDVQDFQEGINSWLRSQPDNIVVEDVIYNHTTRGTLGKDALSVAIISRAASNGEID